MNQERILAHSHNDQGIPHLLADHLQAVARDAESLMPDAAYKLVAYYAGLWHDLGKYNPRWQARLKEVSGLRQGRIGIPHAQQGASFACKYSLSAAFCIYGHHAGLPDRTDFRNWLIDPDTQNQRTTSCEEAIAYAAIDFPSTLQPEHNLPAPDNWEQQDLMTRFLFSALVDADYTDTAHHFASSRLPTIEQESMADLLQRFEVEREQLINKDDSEINRVRADIYKYCIQAGSLPQGLFKLAAPTGGGKTLSLMGFGLHHAVTHRLERIIYAAPFTSIIDQTASIYRRVLGERAVLEHHSAIQEENPDTDHMGLLRLAAQNWEFPIVVTTTVQLLESLFSNRPSRCRKLHNIAKSVIVLDEVQALPVKYLEPILSILQALVNYYDCSVVFCTATQPAYKHIKGLSRQMTEIIPSAALSLHFNQLKRVEYRNETRVTWEWVAVAADIQARGGEQVLIVCNTTTDAQNGLIALAEVFPEEECYHLSTRMYGAHRLRVLKEIKDKLRLRQRVYLVSTQLIEAGVDFDFADGYRVIAPLDSIVQTAGRINRNGRMGRMGTLTVFRLQGGKFPSKDYENAARESQILLDQGQDLNTPHIFEDYFRKRFKNQNHDQEKIQDLRKKQQFKSVSQKFRLIDDDTVSVFVADEPEAKAILTELENKVYWTKQDYRRMQPYLVNLRNSFLERRLNDTKKTEQGLLVWQGLYDTKRGIV